MTRAVVLGVGNLLMTDEGVGPHTIGALERGYDIAPEATLIDGGCSAMELLDDMAAADLLLIVDAVAGGRAPGSIVRLEGEDVPRFFTTKLSPHQVGLCDVLATLAITDESPKETIIIGVEPAKLAMGMELSPIVAAAVPRVMDQVVGELTRHGIGVRARAA
ncbi:MAG TPA: HyaD/HybD family hydrogenase maturation endopeptidase [Usitatibacter sp.]|nr:HyaD/HybD family hydrogenase maturation endopeptidase [Usitatibacter sp.]